MGEWVRGAFAATTIEGFIVGETCGSYDIIVKKIEETSEPLPPLLKVGSIQKLPKRIIETFYTRLNKEQQATLIELSISQKQDEWTGELLDQFYNPFFDETGFKKQEKVYSNLLRTYVELDDDMKKNLFHYYQGGVDAGLSTRFDSPCDIDNGEKVDVAISYIVLVSKNKEGINFVKEIANR